MRIIQTLLIFVICLTAISVHAQPSIEPFDATISFEDVERPCIQVNLDPESKKTMDFYTQIVEDENGSEMKVFVRLGYDIYITHETYPNEYAAIPEITPEFTVRTTAENLAEAIDGESYEFNTMYPEFITNANEAGNYMAQISLTYAYKVEQKHRDFYIDALAALNAGTDHSLPTIYFLCPTCGNTYATTAPSRCEISMTDSKLFIKVTSL